MSKLPVRAIIFDLYGVLAINGWQAFKAHHFSDKEHIWDQIFELGRKVDAGLVDYNELLSFTAKQSGESEAVVRYQLEHTALNTEILTYVKTELKPYYTLGILSNASSNKVIDELFTSEQEALFEAIVLSHHVGLTKPQTAMYEAIAMRLRLDCSECVFIDDQERHVQGAREAGMQAIVYTDVAQLQVSLQELL